VSDALKTRYQKVNFPIHEAADGSVVHHHLACSGARVTVDKSNPVPTGSYKLLENQVDYVLKHLSANPTLVSITIGANDFGFTNEAKIRKHLAPPEWGGETEEDFHKWADKTVLKVKEQLQPLVNRLLLEPNVVIVITDLYDPMNKKATKFWAAGVGEASVEACRTCRSRLEYGLDKLNNAFVSMRDALASGLVNPARLQLTGETKAEGIRAAFRGHEAPHKLPLTGSCGKAPPGLDGTWIQPWPDCIHPNAKGAVQIGKTVNFAASNAGR